MQTLRMAINPYGLAARYDDPGVFVESAKAAEAAGFSQYVVTDHVVMGECTDAYPYGAWPTPLDFPWWEPMTVLAAIAAATHRIELTQGILIAPLRSAVLLAKQAATLDRLSGGRLALGLGTGWQREEYAASGLNFADRRGFFIEQLRAMKCLWTQRCASFTGEHIRFEQVYSSPRPTRPTGVPIHVGMAPSAANLPWMAELADGWLPIETEPARYAPDISRIKAALEKQRRDPAAFCVRAKLPTVAGLDGLPCLRATLARRFELIRHGVTMAEIYPLEFLRGDSRAELADWMDTCAELLAADRDTDV